MTHLKIGRVFIILLGLLSITCHDSEVETRSYPVIDTKPVTEINVDGANLNAEILNLGNEGISDHGFVYDDVANPALGKSDRISLGKTKQKGAFSTLANRNLVKDKRYYVKAYAISINNDFIVYGQEVEFISLGGSVPEVKDIVPKQGSIGDTILITGSGFSNIQVNNIVSFASVRSQVIRATSDSLWCIVPVSTRSGESELSLTLGQFTVKSKINFFLKPISLTSFNPTSASFGDTITISGLNFPMQKSLITSTLLGKEASIVSNSSSELKVIVANNVFIPESTIIVNAGVQTVISADDISLLKPIINSFNPAKGTKDTEVIISGNYFSPIKENNIVEINGSTLTVVEASKTTLKVRIPSGISPGSYTIGVTVATQNVVSTSQIEIVKPLIANVNPIKGTWSNTITISGENFGNSINDNIVKFDDVQATIISASPNEIKVFVPNNLLKKTSILSVQAITTDNFSTVYNIPFMLDAPTITSFTPDQGKSTSQVTINGSNFNPITTNQIVTFGDHVAEVLDATSNQLIVKLPTSLIDSNVKIRIDVAEQFVMSNQLFHLISAWKRVSDFVGIPRGDGSSFTIGDYGYVGLGDQGGSNYQDKKIWKYDPIADSWSEISTFSFPSEGTGAEFVNMISFSFQFNAYVGLGAQGSWPEGRIRKYNPISNSWTDATSIGNDASRYATDGAVSYSINGRGYVTSGRERNSSTSFKMWEYDPDADSWIRKSDLPASSRWEAAGFSIGAKAYLIGGAPCQNCGIYLDDCWEYDVINNRWRQLVNFPGIRRMSSTGFSLNGIGYLIGGQVIGQFGTSLIGDFWKYDPTLDSWTKLEDFPGEQRASAVSFELNGKIYYGTGQGIGRYLNDFWEFDPSKL